MKKIFAVTITCFFLINCSSSDSNQTNQIRQSIKGNWKLIQYQYYDFQNPTDEHFVANGYEITFNQDLTFISNFLYDYQNGVYLGGIYSVSQDSILTIKFKANSLPDQIYKKKIRDVSTTFLDLSNDLTPNGTGCIEGCGERFQKLP